MDIYEDFSADSNPRLATDLAGRRVSPREVVLRVGIVGMGAVGPVLGAAFAQAGHQLVGVSARSAAARERADTMLPGVPVLGVADLVPRCDLVLFCVRDRELEPLVREVAQSGLFQAGQLVAHTAGAYGLSVLHPAVEAGAIPLSLHPAQTFSGTSLDLQRLRGAHWAVNAPVPLLPVAQALVLDLEGVPHMVADQFRGQYHAALAHGANHLVTVVTQAVRTLRGAGVENPAAFLEPLLKSALDRALSEGESGLSGPILRGDVSTVKNHLATLDSGALVDAQDCDPGQPADDLADVSETYRAAARATAARVHARGILDDVTYLALLEAL